MSLKRFILVFVLLCSFSAIDFQVEGALSMAKTRRTQSMRLLTSHKTENNIKTHTQSGSESAGSSLTELRAPNSHPIASTSTGKKFDSTTFEEVDLTPLVEQARRTGFINSINLNEASSSTHSNGNINPARDGVFARIRSAMLRHGTAGVIGSAIGVGGFEIKKKLFPGEFNDTHVNNTQVDSSKYKKLFISTDNIKKNSISVNNDTTPDYDGIINPL